MPSNSYPDTNFPINISGVIPLSDSGMHAVSANYALEHEAYPFSRNVNITFDPNDKTPAMQFIDKVVQQIESDIQNTPILKELIEKKSWTRDERILWERAIASKVSLYFDENDIFKGYRGQNNKKEQHNLNLLTPRDVYDCDIAASVEALTLQRIENYTLGNVTREQDFYRAPTDYFIIPSSGDITAGARNLASFDHDNNPASSIGHAPIVSFSSSNLIEPTINGFTGGKPHSNYYRQARDGATIFHHLAGYPMFYIPIDAEHNATGEMMSLFGQVIHSQQDIHTSDGKTIKSEDFLEKRLQALKDKDIKTLSAISGVDTLNNDIAFMIISSQRFLVENQTIAEDPVTLGKSSKLIDIIYPILEQTSLKPFIEKTNKRNLSEYITAAESSTYLPSIEESFIIGKVSEQLTTPFPIINDRIKHVSDSIKQWRDKASSKSQQDNIEGLKKLLEENAIPVSPLYEVKANKGESLEDFIKRSQKISGELPHGITQDMYYDMILDLNPLLKRDHKIEAGVSYLIPTDNYLKNPELHYKNTFAFAQYIEGKEKDSLNIIVDTSQDRSKWPQVATLSGKPKDYEIADQYRFPVAEETGTHIMDGIFNPKSTPNTMRPNPSGKKL